MSEYWGYSRSISLLPVHLYQTLRAARAQAVRARAALDQAQAAESETNLAAQEAEDVFLETGAEADLEAADAAFDLALTAEEGAIEAEMLLGAAETAVVAAEGAIAAAVLAFGGAIGQGAAWLISSRWDPVEPLYPLVPNNIFTSVNDLEIDTALLARPFNLPMRHRVLGLNRRHPGLGTLSLDFVRLGVRTFVDASQGAAAATAKNKADLKKAAAALKQDLKAYAQASTDLADALDYYKRVGRRLPRVSLQQLDAFVDRAKIKRLPFLIDLEGAMIQQLLTLARVRADHDIRDDLYAWIAAGPSAIERKAFQAARYETL